MSTLGPGQRSIVVGVGIAAAAAAVVLLGLRQAGTTSLAPHIPLLLLVAAMGLIVASRGGALR